MKRFVLILYTIFLSMAAIAQTISIDWKIGNDIYSQSTCEYGGDLIVPTAPTKYGYTFQGWKKPYTDIEYIESTGTQWINTGVVPNSAIKVKTRIYINQRFSSWNFIFGSTTYRHSSSKDFGITFRDQRFYMDYNGTKQTNATASLNQWYDVETESNGASTYLKINGEMVYTTPSTYYPLQTTYPIGLFTLYGPDGSGWGSSIRMKYIQIWKDDVLVRNFIPVLDSNGVPCMYDKVENKFYYNSGNGQFAAGPVVGGE